MAWLRLRVSAVLQQNLGTRGTARRTGVKQRAYSIDGGSVDLTHTHTILDQYTAVYTFIFLKVNFFSLKA